MTTFSPAHREKLADVRQRKHAAREKMVAAREAVRIASEHDDPGAATHAEMALAQARGEESLAVELESALLHQFASTSGGGFGGETFLRNPDRVRDLDQLGNSRLPIDRQRLGYFESEESLVGRLQSGDWGPRPMAASTVPDTTVGRRGPFTELGLVPQLRRRIRLLDLIPSRVAEGNTVPYVIKSGNQDLAAETAEGAIKPAGDVGLTDAEVKVQVIAEWIKANRPLLSDMPGMDQLLRDDLSYEVLRRYERQVLLGDGVGSNLLGILNTGNIAEVPFVASTPLTNMVLKGITTVILSDAEPDGIVLHPVDHEAMLVATASGSGERLDSGGAFTAVPQTMWDLPKIVTSLMPAGQALVGSFAQGATLWIREAISVVMGTESDDMIRNRVTLLGEMRAALTVQQPRAFALVYLQ